MCVRNGAKFEEREPVRGEDDRAHSAEVRPCVRRNDRDAQRSLENLGELRDADKVGSRFQRVQPHGHLRVAGSIRESACRSGDGAPPFTSR